MCKWNKIEGLKCKGENFNLKKDKAKHGLMMRTKMSHFGVKRLGLFGGEKEKERRQEEKKKNEEGRREEEEEEENSGLEFMFGTLIFVCMETHVWNFCLEFMFGISLFVWKSLFV